MELVRLPIDVRPAGSLRAGSRGQPRRQGDETALLIHDEQVPDSRCHTAQLFAGFESKHCGGCPAIELCCLPKADPKSDVTVMRSAQYQVMLE